MQNKDNSSDMIINKAEFLTMNGIMNAIQDYISECAYDVTNEQYIIQMDNKEIKMDKDALQTIVNFIDDTLFDSFRYALEGGIGRFDNSVGLFDIDMAIEWIKRRE